VCLAGARERETPQPAPRRPGRVARLGRPPGCRLCCKRRGGGAAAPGGTVPLRAPGGTVPLRAPGGTVPLRALGDAGGPDRAAEAARRPALCMVCGALWMVCGALWMLCGALRMACSPRVPLRSDVAGSRDVVRGVDDLPVSRSGRFAGPDQEQRHRNRGGREHRRGALSSGQGHLDSEDVHRVENLPCPGVG
jgi:hypothetical protein